MERKDLKEIGMKLNEVWHEVQNDRYMCYTIKELAYNIAYKIGSELDNSFETTIYYKHYDNKHKIRFALTKLYGQTVYMGFDIIETTGMFGDYMMHIRNGKITGKLPKGYQDIEEVFEDEEEEAI